MRAIVIDEFGPPEALRLATLPTPDVGAHEVLLRTHVVAVNPVDAKTRAGFGVSVDHFPAVLGWDLCGEVVHVGPDVVDVHEHDVVFGMPRFPGLAGAYAEYVVSPANEVVRKPDGVDVQQAAAAPMVALTAWQAIFTLGGLQSGQRVLVHGAAGGVGHVAVQLARWAGAEVMGTASARNRAFVTELGAHEIVDYTSTPLESIARDIDLVIDTRGGDDLIRLLDVLRPGGLIVSLLGRDEQAQRAASTKGVRVAFAYVAPDRPSLARISELMAAGTLRIAIDRVFPLAEAAAAHTLIESGHVRGRILLQP
jgi:NADPH:quinone reductase-like Zn-dependent oxidoreductase